MIIDIGNRKKFKQLTFTLSISILLLLLNILFELLPPEKITPKIQIDNQLSSNELTEEVHKLFPKFNLDTNNIQKFDYIDKDKNVSHQINLNISSNFPQIILIRELYNLIKDYNFDIKVVEEKIRGNSVIKIFQNSKIILTINLRIDKKIIDTETKISIICAAKNLSQKDIDLITDLPFKISFAVLPTENNYEIISQIHSKKFHYGILISDDINDYKFLLKNGTNKSRLKSSIFNINNSFSNAHYVLFDNYSKLLTSQDADFIMNEFNSFQITQYFFNEINILKEGEDKDIVSMFKYIVSKNYGKSYLLMVNLDDFYKIYDLLYIYYLKGIKYEYPNYLYNKTNNVKLAM